MPLSPGDSLGPYEILAPIGAGGMGEVWKARDSRLGRIVAIKQLRSEFAARFEQEARAVAALNHPHICQIYDIGPDYLVLEFLEGVPLSGPIPVEEAIKIALQIAGALEEAHAHGILHRDLKPANILLTARGAKLLDFGLATAPADGDTTRTMGVAGTPLYMSPEQAEGKPLDARSDVFSLGTVLYEMLSGSRPFHSLAEVLCREPSGLEVPAGIWSIVSRCLRKLPSERFQGVAELRTALEKCASKPSEASQPSIAVLPFANMSRDPDDEYFSDGLAEEIINLLVQIPGLKVIARTSAFAFRGKEQDIRTIARTLGVSTILEGSVRRSGNRIRVTAQLISANDGSHLLSERFDRQMADVFAMQDEIAAAITAALRLKLSGPQSGLRQYTPGLAAYETLLRARHYANKMTPQSLARSRELLEQAIALEPGYALLYAELAVSFLSMTVLDIMPPHGATPLARAAARKALEIEPSQPEGLSALGWIAAVYDYDWAEAGRLFELAFKRGPVSSIVRSRYSRYLQALGRSAEAITELRKSLSDDPLNVYVRMTLAIALNLASRTEDAAEECRRILEFDETNHMAWWQLSVSNWNRGNAVLARQQVERAMSLAPWNLMYPALLAAYRKAAGEEEGASELLERLGNGEAPGAATAYYYHYLLARDIEPAADWIAKAIAQRAPTVGLLLSGPDAALLRCSRRWPEIAELMRLPATV